MIFFNISYTASTILFLITISSLSLIAVQACRPTCRSHRVPYPFGFSSGCKIPLNCSPDGTMLLNEFPIQNITQEKIRIKVQPKCNRSINAFETLFTRNFAPLSTNAILLNNCSSSLPCNIPDISVDTRFESLNCSTSANVSCLFNLTSNNFFDRRHYSGEINRCEYFLSSISSSTSAANLVSLDVRVMDLGWWLNGNHCQCSEHASCSNVSTPQGPGYRCHCKDGFSGDGYVAGSGCRRGPCNLKKYFSGQCGGAARIFVIIGGVGAVAAFMVALFLICCFIRRQSYTTKARGFRRLKLTEASNISIPIYPYKEIEKATNCFSDKQRLGTGAYGTVYAGKLRNDSWVAIKRIKNTDLDDSIEQVINEIKLISSVNHPNLVRLLGCSIDNGEQILVYEFMPNGTLCQHLQREKGDVLAWPVRLTIAVETAQAVAHLHSAINPPIYHRDIKSSNILLDYNLRSKVADFGLSRLGMTEISHISTAPQGTPGYVDPQYHQNFHLSDKSDVYSFGVVLVEIITALKVVDFSRRHNEINLAALATDRIGQGRLAEIIDPLLDMQSDPWTFSSIQKVAELGFRCLAFDKDMRPTMMEVAAELERIRLSKWTPSEEINCRVSSLEPSCSSSSSPDISEKPLSSADKKGAFGNVSTQRKQCSPSTSSMLNAVIVQ